ncbi:hypothetical protein L207DRAFT_341498 [Hyaloscypha variabilis F]|uniref:Uncharacterized protein n=1 Tax=Hyaloscypha variabilis (strain UAMH 11265 / GT02V1 / F) TaxID=1149755 RepID=A0A2J6RPX6_HYAVF|nr:hypothetical protein L207DRAFT_341498 [Hyaloscypha variabilis F]
MHYESTILVFLAAACISALPLNINLGAYSPALVVGDGEISFGSGAEAEALVNTLSGASAGTEAATTIEGLTRAGEGTPTVVAPETASAKKRDLAGFNAALNFATGALTTSPGVELGTGEGESGVGITVKPSGAIARREDGGLPNVTLQNIRTLSDQRGAEVAV